MRFTNLIQLVIGYFLFLFSSQVAAGDSRLVQKLLDKEGAKGPIFLTDKTFDKIVSGPRDYDILVLLTAVNVQYGCQFCRIFDPDYNLVASSWHSAHKTLGDGLVFATADLSQNGKIFREVSFVMTFLLNCLAFLDPNTYYSSNSLKLLTFGFTERMARLSPIRQAMSLTTTL